MQWEAWIEEVRNGNQTTFEKLHDRFQPLILKHVTRFHWYKDREELLQEARITLYLAILEYSPDKCVAFPGYVASRIHYRLWNTVKRSTRIWNHEWQDPKSHGDGDTEEVYDHMAQLACPHAACAYEDIEHEEIFTCLSNRERLAAHYLFIERLKPSELAEICGVSVETVKTWRKRAIQKLRRVLARE